MWMVKCKPGQEQEAAIQIMRKALFRESVGKPLGVRLRLNAAIKSRVDAVAKVVIAVLT